MKIVCPFCKGRIHTVYIRSAAKGKYQFVGLGNYFWCATDDMIFVPMENLITGTGPNFVVPKGHELMGNAKRLVPEKDTRTGPAPLKPTGRRARGKIPYP